MVLRTECPRLGPIDSGEPCGTLSCFCYGKSSSSLVISLYEESMSGGLLSMVHASLLPRGFRGSPYATQRSLPHRSEPERNDPQRNQRQYQPIWFGAHTAGG